MKDIKASLFQYHLLQLRVFFSRSYQGHNLVFFRKKVNELFEEKIIYILSKCIEYVLRYSLFDKNEIDLQKIKG